MTSLNRRGKGLAVAVIAATFILYWYLESLLALVPGYRELSDRFEYYIPRTILSAAEIALVVLAVCVLHRIGPLRSLVELGLRGEAGRAAGFGLAATAPMALVFGLTHELAPDPAPAILYGSFVSPLAEEIVFRGFLFGQLWRRAGWNPWLAIALSSLAFGYGHAEDATGLVEGLGLLALTGIGAVVFAWLYWRWRTLVAPLALHCLMNLCWSLWQVGDGALAGWMPFALQALTIALAIGLTVWWTRRGEGAGSDPAP